MSRWRGAPLRLLGAVVEYADKVHGRRVEAPQGVVEFGREVRLGIDAAWGEILMPKGLGSAGGVYSSPADSALRRSRSCFSRSLACSLVSTSRQASFRGSVTGCSVLRLSCLEVGDGAADRVRQPSAEGRTTGRGCRGPRVWGSTITRSAGMLSKRSSSTRGCAALK